MGRERVRPEKRVFLCHRRWTADFRTSKGTWHIQSCSPAGQCTFWGHSLTVCASFGLTEKGPVYRKSLGNKRAGHHAPEQSNSRTRPQPSPRGEESPQKVAPGCLPVLSQQQAPVVTETANTFPSDSYFSRKHSQHLNWLVFFQNV